MAHLIDNNRFVSYQEPAWHRLGTVSQVPMTGLEAYDMMGGYSVEARPIPGYTDMPDLITPYQHLVRLPSTDYPAGLSFGMVGPDYRLITPRRLAELWDESISRPVETMGALKEGRLMFITTKLPTFSIKGDDVDNYLMVVNGMDGSKCAEIRVSPVRVVCNNTLVMSASVATENYRLVHDETVETRLKDWLSTIMETAERNTARIKEAFDLLASRKATKADVTTVLDAAYKAPKRPVKNAPDSVMVERLKWWENMVASMSLRKATALNLFEGAGTGMDVKAARGTFWGLYNAVVEVEDRRPGARSPEALSYETLFGDRAASKEAAFTQAMDLLSGKNKAAKLVTAGR